MGGGLSETVISYINIYNDSINENIDAAIDEYTKDVVSERDRLSLENQSYVSELEELKSQLLLAKTTIESLQKENSEYKAREEETIAVMKRIYRM